MVNFLQAKVESQMANSLSSATQAGQQEPSEAPPPSHFRSTLPVPGASASGNLSTSAAARGQQDMTRYW